MTVVDSLDRLFDEAVLKHAQPLWPVLGDLSPETPTAKAVPFAWRYEDLRPYCERAARLVGTDLAERRVFMLVNPALKAPRSDGATGLPWDPVMILVDALRTLGPDSTAEQIRADILHLRRLGGNQRRL